jgi:hypothetical protein
MPMNRNDLACLLAAIIGLILFLFGSNAYNAALGWSGLFLLVAGIIAEIVLDLRGVSRKEEIHSNS